MATSRHPISARMTASGSAPPANPAPAMIENATAAAGAMWVIDWNRTSRSPMASRARPTEGARRSISRPPCPGMDHSEGVASGRKVGPAGCGLRGEGGDPPDRQRNPQHDQPDEAPDLDERPDPRRPPALRQPAGDDSGRQPADVGSPVD